MSWEIAGGKISAGWKKNEGRAEKLGEKIRFHSGDNLIISISFFIAFVSAFSHLVFLFFPISFVYLDSSLKAIELMMRKINWFENYALLARFSTMVERCFLRLKGHERKRGGRKGQKEEIFNTINYLQVSKWIQQSKAFRNKSVFASRSLRYNLSRKKMMTIMMLLYVSLLFKGELFIMFRDIIFNSNIAGRNFQQKFNPNWINFGTVQGFRAVNWPRLHDKETF